MEGNLSAQAKRSRRVNANGSEERFYVDYRQGEAAPAFWMVLVYERNYLNPKRVALRLPQHSKPLAVTGRTTFQTRHNDEA